MRQNDLKKRLEAMIAAMSDERLRWLIGKSKFLIDKGEMSSKEYERLMDSIIQTEMERKMIINELKIASLTTSEISHRLKLPSKLIFKHLMALIHYKMVAISDEREGELEFQLL